MLAQCLKCIISGNIWFKKENPHKAGYMEFVKMSKGQEKLLKLFVWSTVILNAATLICISIIAKRLSS